MYVPSDSVLRERQWVSASETMAQSAMSTGLNEKKAALRRSYGRQPVSVLAAQIGSLRHNRLLTRGQISH
jgi:hypothetical protein